MSIGNLIFYRIIFTKILL